MAIRERPTCRTCPYWSPDETSLPEGEARPADAEELRERARSGHCVHDRPRLVPFASAHPVDPKQVMVRGVWLNPETLADRGCSEHPEAAKYAAWFQEQRIRAAIRRG